MEIKKHSLRDPQLIKELVDIWHASVLATHTFLTERDIEKIAEYVPDAVKNIPTLITAEQRGVVIGFAGVDGEKLEMLFIHPDFRGQGTGKQIVEYLLENCGIKEVCVNEQNPRAKGFYEHMGFEVYRRTETDEQGNAFPSLYMKYKK
ncbi:GNAT family N-acetyltransferase [Blautia producta]|uniref:GNAT family N-acetyltransferase n=1 Tax=Blautia producta TaxID=33035 RepID=UPI0031B60183